MIKKRFSTYCVMFACMLSLTIGWTLQQARAEEKAAPQKSEKAKAQPEKAVKKSANSKAVLVEVDGSKLTQGDVDKEINAQLEAIKKQIPPERLKELQAQIDQMKGKIQEQKINEFVERTVIGKEADKQKISVTDNETKAIIKQYEQQVPAGMTLESVLAMQGMTLAKMNDEIKFRLRAQKLIDSQVKQGAAPTEDEIKQYYTSNKEKFDDPESVHARHILIKTDAKDNETVKNAKKAKIDDLRKKVVSGADFAKTAQESSDCPSKAKGGDLGTFSRGRMIKPFEDAAFSQKINDIGPVVETQFGYHIIQVLEHNQAKSKTLDDVKDKITETLNQQKKNQAIKDYIEGLKKNAKIVYSKS